MENPLYLCYNKLTDQIYTSKTRSDIVLYEAHENKGYTNNPPKFKIPNTNFEILIRSNFGYGNAAYLKCYLWNDNIKLLAYNQWIENLNFTLDFFRVAPSPNNWQQIFEYIEVAYKNRNSWNYDNAVKVLDNISNILCDLETLNIRPYSWSKATFKYDRCDKIKFILKKIEELFIELTEAKLVQFKQINTAMKSISGILISLIAISYKDINASNKPNEVKDDFIKHLAVGYDTIYKLLKNEQMFDIILTHLK